MSILLFEKKNVRKILLLVIVSISINSCTTNNKINIVETFPINDSLIASEIKVPVNLLRPFKIISTDSTLIIYDHLKKEIFKIFKLPSVNYLFSWGTKGKGPDEINLVEFNSLNSFHDRFVFLDHLKLKTVIIEGDSIKISNTQMLNPRPEPINGLRIINDSIFIIDGASNKKFEHTCVNINNDKKSFHFGHLDDILNIKDYAQREMTYLNKMTVKPDGKRIAVFYLWFNKFKLYHSNGELIKEVSIKNKNLERKFSLPTSIELYKKNILYHIEVFATDNFIFTLNPNVSISEDSNDKYPSLSVWDWYGNPIAEYKLDKKVTSFTISEKYNKIYAVSLNQMNAIYVYELPSILIKNKLKSI